VRPHSSGTGNTSTPRGAAGELGLAAAVPVSLGRTTNVEQILQDPTSRGSVDSTPLPLSSLTLFSLIRLVHYQNLQGNLG
jgi:hypothetical protein